MQPLSYLDNARQNPTNGSLDTISQADRTRINRLPPVIPPFPRHGMWDSQSPLHPQQQDTSHVPGATGPKLYPWPNLERAFPHNQFQPSVLAPRMPSSQSQNNGSSGLRSLSHPRVQYTTLRPSPPSYAQVVHSSSMLVPDYPPPGYSHTTCLNSVHPPELGNIHVPPPTGPMSAVRTQAPPMQSQMKLPYPQYTSAQFRQQQQQQQQPVTLNGPRTWLNTNTFSASKSPPTSAARVFGQEDTSIRPPSLLSKQSFPSLTATVASHGNVSKLRPPPGTTRNAQGTYPPLQDTTQRTLPPPTRTVFCQRQTPLPPPSPERGNSSITNEDVMSKGLEKTRSEPVQTNYNTQLLCDQTANAKYKNPRSNYRHRKWEIPRMAAGLKPNQTANVGDRPTPGEVAPDIHAPDSPMKRVAVSQLIQEIMAASQSQAALPHPLPKPSPTSANNGTKSLGKK